MLIGTLLVNNFVLAQFLGLCPFLGVTQNTDTAIAMGLATTFVLTLSAASAHLLYHFVLIPLDLVYLKLLVFIVVIAGVVQFTEIYLKNTSARLYRVLGVYLPLITTNCAVLGVALLAVGAELNFVQTLFYAIGAALGFSLVMTLFGALRERIDQSSVPPSFRGAPIALISAGFMSLAFMGFAGLSG